MEISINNIKDKLVTVMGLGRNGGGLATAKFFAEKGAIVTVTDLKTEKELQPSVEKLAQYKNIKFVLGEHRIEDFENADIVIKNPGVKLEGNKFLKVAKQIETDISIFLAISKAPILAVTGSKGKSSTVKALHYGLKQLGYNAFLGGNITVSPLNFLEETNENTPVVLELSSWQLADLRNSNLLKPKVAIITPVMPDHLNWYGTMEKYLEDKKLIYKNMTEENFLICNSDDEWGKIFAKESKAKVLWYSEKELEENKEGVFFDKEENAYCKVSQNSKEDKPKIEQVLSSIDSKIPGIKLKQNLANASLALLLYDNKNTQKNAKKIMQAMKDYGGLEHRLEFFHEYNNIKFYNDTAATIPQATVAALKAFKNAPILICGGTDKKIDFTLLAKNAHLAKKIFLLQGSGTNLLLPLLEKENITNEGVFDKLEDLLVSVKSKSEEGDIVLLSPGAASFGMFKNEFDRGNQFKETVKKLFK